MVRSKKRIVVQGSVVQGERLGYLGKKGKGTGLKKNGKHIETKKKKERTSTERHHMAGQQKTVGKQQKQELKKDQKRRITDGEYYATPEKSKRKERDNYSPQQEARNRDEQKRAVRRERYSKNRSGFTASSSLPHRRGRF